jgi:hypothetical protein
MRILGRSAERKGRDRQHAGAIHLTRVYALLFGVVYTLVGAIGFVVAPGLDERKLLFLFEINAPHNVVHSVIGLAGLYAVWRGKELQYAQAMTFLFSILTVAAFLPQPLFGLLRVDGANLFLHGTTAILGETVSRFEHQRKEETLEREWDLRERDLKLRERELEAGILNRPHS